MGGQSLTATELAYCANVSLDGERPPEQAGCTGSTSIENSSAWAELLARDNCEPRSKNALQLGG
jgi:hypothetical protein